MSWRAHYERGELAPAIEELREYTRRGPAAAELALLALLLGMAGRWEEAVVSLQRACALDPAVEGSARQLERCLSSDQLRDARRTDPARPERAVLGGALPSFLALRAQASALHAAGDLRAARAVLERAGEATPPQGGALLTRGGTRMPFDDITDIDDLTGPCLELVEAGLIEVPFSRARRVVFGERRGMQDGLYLPVVIEPREGPRLEGRVPLLYAGTFRSPPGPVCVGRDSRVSRDPGYAVAVGRRDLRLRAASGGAALVAVDTVAEIELDAVAPKPGADDESERTTWRPPAVETELRGPKTRSA